MLFVTPAELAHLAEATDPQFRAPVLTAGYSGLMAGEISALKVERGAVPAPTRGRGPSSHRGPTIKPGDVVSHPGHLVPPGQRSQIRDELPSVSRSGTATRTARTPCSGQSRWPEPSREDVVECSLVSLRTKDWGGTRSPSVSGRCRLTSPNRTCTISRFHDPRRTTEYVQEELRLRPTNADASTRGERRVLARSAPGAAGLTHLPEVPSGRVPSWTGRSQQSQAARARPVKALDDRQAYSARGHVDGIRIGLRRHVRFEPGAR